MIDKNLAYMLIIIISISSIVVGFIIGTTLEEADIKKALCLELKLNTSEYIQCNNLDIYTTIKGIK